MKAPDMPPDVRMDYRSLSDEAFVHAFESCHITGESFRHADHVRLAWIYVTRFGPRMAEERFSEGLRRLAAQLGIPEKFHLTVTLAWLRVVAARVKSDQVQSFDDWISIHLELLDRSFLHNYYSEPCLTSAVARANWVEPDRRPLDETRIADADREVAV